MRRRQKRYIELLSKHAKGIEPVDGSKHAAAVVIKNKVVGLGTNTYKSHPFADKYAHRDGAIYPHAETSAIMDALRTVDDLSKATLYVVRVRKNGKHGMSKPCSGCEKCINDFGIKKVVYTTEEGVAEL
jgi:deoxycytidylate deaminase